MGDINSGFPLQELGLLADSEGTLNMTVYCPYWMVNKTGKPLEYKVRRMLGDPGASVKRRRRGSGRGERGWGGGGGIQTTALLFFPPTPPQSSFSTVPSASRSAPGSPRVGSAPRYRGHTIFCCAVTLILSQQLLHKMMNPSAVFVARIHVCKTQQINTYM